GCVWLCVFHYLREVCVCVCVCTSKAFVCARTCLSGPWFGSMVVCIFCVCVCVCVWSDPSVCHRSWGWWRPLGRDGAGTDLCGRETKGRHNKGPLCFIAN